MDSALTTNVIAFGFYAFGAKGVVYGPLIAVLAKIVIDLTHSSEKDSKQTIFNLYKRSRSNRKHATVISNIRQSKSTN